MNNHSLFHRVRKAIRDLPVYSSARSVAPAGGENVFLDANELHYEPMPEKIRYARYPDQQPDVLISFLSRLYGVDPTQILTTRGADEGIDLCIRTFCVPMTDNIIVCTPTFPMYKHHATVQEAQVREVPLKDDFSLDADAIINAADENTKIIFLCSPNNPTGNLLDRDLILRVVRHFSGRALVVVDEAYIDFSGSNGVSADIDNHENLAVLRTLSKSHGLAGLRIGAVIAQPSVISMLRKILPIYPVSAANLDVIQDIDDQSILKKLSDVRQKIMMDRAVFIEKMQSSRQIEKVFPSHANFVLLKVSDSGEMYQRLKNSGYIGRLYAGNPALENCIRISIGDSETMDNVASIMMA